MKITIIFLLCIASLSCGNQPDQNIEDNLNAMSNSAQAQESFKGKVPLDNPIMVALKGKQNLSLFDADALYRKSVNDYSGEEYSTNLKHFGFKLVYQNGLIDSGTEEQKLYYLNQQIGLKRNFPSIKEFYNLLNSLESLDKVEKTEIAKTFYQKNLAEIETVVWPNEENKKNKVIALNRAFQFFKRSMNVTD